MEDDLFPGYAGELRPGAEFGVSGGPGEGWDAAYLGTSKSRPFEVSTYIYIYIYIYTYIYIGYQACRVGTFLQGWSLGF